MIYLTSAAMLTPNETSQLCTICLNISVETLEVAIIALNGAVDWNTVSVFALPESFIVKYADKLDKSRITYNSKPSEQFIDAYPRLVDWNIISTWYELSEELMRKWIDYVEMDVIAHRQVLSQQFIRDFEPRIAKDTWFYISMYQSFSIDMIDIIRKHKTDMHPTERVIRVIRNNHALATLKLIEDIPEVIVAKVGEYM